nr:MAG TPA: hypothetical protein [Caudoviricetes sp.]
MPRWSATCCWVIPAAFLASLRFTLTVSPFPQLYRLLRLLPSRVRARAIYTATAVYIYSLFFFLVFLVTLRFTFGYAPVLSRFLFGIIPVCFRLRFVFISVFFGLHPVYSRLHPGFISVYSRFYFGLFPVFFGLFPVFFGFVSVFLFLSRYFSENLKKPSPAGPESARAPLRLQAR